MDTLSILADSFAIIVLLVFLLSGFFMGRRVKSAKDLGMGGQSAGSLLVAGNIIGTLVGGSSTVGTAQLAFGSGFSALWFTLGSALGCVLLAVFLVRPLRHSGETTIVGLITREYGAKTGTVAGVLSAFGLIMNLIAQILAANALITVLFPLNSFWCAMISSAMIFLYVFGGIKGTGYLGAVKTVLLYITVIASTVLCIILSGGFSVFGESLPKEQYFNLLSRGAGIDLGAGLSVALGVISTQTYAQAILSAKSDKEAKRGALLSAFIIPLVGIGSMLVGLFMKINYPELVAAKAFPQFILEYMPPFVSQLMLVVLLITVLGTGAGISLGLATTVSNDLIKPVMPKNTSDRRMLNITRTIILAVLIIAVIITQTSLKSTILTWGFMSMGLRAVVLMLPMLCSLFLHGKTRPISAILSASLGLVSMIAVFISPLSEKIDPLIIGMSAAVICYIVTFLILGKPKNHTLKSE